MIEEASDGDGAPPLLNSTRPHQYPASVLGPTIEFALAHARAHKSRARALLLLAICVCLTCPRPRPAQVTRRGGHRAAAERDQLPDGRLHQWHHDLDGSTRSRLDPDASAMASQLVLDDVVDPRGTLASAAVAPLRERTGAKARRAAREQLSLWHIVGRTNHGRRRCDLTAARWSARAFFGRIHWYFACPEWLGRGSVQESCVSGSSGAAQLCMDVP